MAVLLVQSRVGLRSDVFPCEVPDHVASGLKVGFDGAQLFAPSSNSCFASSGTSFQSSNTAACMPDCPALSHIVGRFQQSVGNVDAKLGQYLAERARMVGEGVVQIDGDEFFPCFSRSNHLSPSSIFFRAISNSSLANVRYPSRVPTVSARFQKKSSSGVSP